jgi:hypothetical protein
MIKYVKGDVSIRYSLNKNVSQKRTGVTLTPWYRSCVNKFPLSLLLYLYFIFSCIRVLELLFYFLFISTLEILRYFP